MIVLRALGTAEIETDVTTLTPSQQIAFAAGLYLIVHRGKTVNRARLAELLWPRASAESRAHRLRQTILQLKKLGIVLSSDRTSLQLAADNAQTDFDHFLANDSGTFNRESREFLPGYNPRCSEAFRDWLDTKRAEVHAMVTRVLLRELERRRLQGDWSSVEKIAAACTTLDPLNESVVLAQAEATAMRGGKRAAISLLDRYMAEVGDPAPDLKVPATILRRRIIERVPDRPAVVHSDPPFVGRLAEMELLVRAFERARSSNGSVTLILGEPGIGKSRLTAELARFAELQGASILRATCRRTDLDRPLSLFVDIVPHLREMPGALGCTPETFAWLKRLTEFEHRPDDISRPIDSAVLFQNVREALFDLLDSVADERCLVILIDDVQWLDPPSASLLARMVEWCETKRVVLVVNSHPTESSFLSHAKKIRVNTITLGGLESAASAALLKSIILRSGEASEPEFLEWCLSAAEGNPFFLQELAHHWVETGHRYEAPPSVNRVLQERLSRLTTEALQVLQTCAVLGDYASMDRVKGVLECQSHRLLAAVQELSVAGMLRTHEGADSMAGQLQPRHDFLSSAAIGRLASITLAFLHRRSADVLEKEIAKAAMPATLLWACANHSHRAGDRKRALTLRLSCAQHLMDVGLVEEACKRYEDALTQCASDEDRLAVLSPLSVALQLNGEWERSKEVLQTCIRVSANTEGSNGHSEFEVQLYQARHRSSLDFVALLEDILPCVKSRAASAQHRMSAAVVALKVASDVGPSSMLDDIYSEIEPLLKLEEVDLVHRLEAEIIYQTMRGKEEIDIKLLERFVDVARSSHGEVAYSHALMAASNACRIAAQDEDARRFVDLAFDHALDHRLRARIPVIRMGRVRLHVARCDWVAAREVLCTGAKYPIPDDDTNTRAEWDFYDAIVRLEEGDLLRVQDAIAKFGRLMPPTFSANRRAACLAMKLRLLLANEESGEAVRSVVQELEETHKVNRDIGNQDFEAHALFLGHAALGQQEYGFQLLRDYVQDYRTTRRQLRGEIQELLRTHRSGVPNKNQLCEMRR
jgi:DNA-binding SARP family transcriptional activator